MIKKKYDINYEISNYKINVCTSVLLKRILFLNYYFKIIGIYFSILNSEDFMCNKKDIPK